MIRKTPLSLVILVSGVVAFAQTKSYESPNKTIRALIVPVGAESRVEIRSASGALLRRRNFVSLDHAEQIVGRERRERVSQLDSSGDA
jgi:hypothetical protein